MCSPEKNQAIASVVAFIEDLFPAAEVAHGKAVQTDIDALAFGRFDYPFVVRHGSGPRDLMAILLKDDLLEDEDGREILERRLREADLAGIAASSPHATIEIGKETIEILDAGEA